MHLDTIPFISIRRYIVPSFRVDRARSNKVFVKMVDEFKDIAFHCAGYSNVIDQAGGKD